MDYLTVIGLTEIIGFWYIYSNIIGASLGAITNFLLARNWAFYAKDASYVRQAVKYTLVSIGSLILNTLGLYLLTEYSSLNYIASKIIVGILIAFFYNFLLQKFFVFKR